MTSLPWSIAYHDGSANAFHARDDGTGASFEYVPVTAEQSSSGCYFGGEPKRGPFVQADVDAVWAKIRALEDDRARHTTDRRKGSGAFSLHDARGTRDFIVQHCPALAALDAIIAGL